jgi:DNA polymerase-3 subunit gamma/tau
MADIPDEPYQSLYRRFRPATFSEIRGQDHIVLALRNAVRDGRVAHAYLFSGPRGTGKTTTARVLAKALNCTDLRDGEPCGVCTSCVEITKGTSLDVHELDAASNNGVEAMRDLVARAALGTPGRQKVYIVDEVHMLSTPASNALLKTLEEPPSHVVFVLATTDPQKVLPTIRSRTQHFEFRLLGPDVLGELLSQVRDQAHLEVPDQAIDLAVRRGRGSARDALSVLDQVAASETVDDDIPELDEVVEALADRDAGRALVAIAQLTGAGFGPQQLAGDLVDHLRQRFLTLVAPDLVAVSEAEREARRSQAERMGLASLVRAMEELGLAQVAMRDAPDPRVNLEVALVRLAHPEVDDSPTALLARIERLEVKSRDAEAAGGSPTSHAGGGSGTTPSRPERSGPSALRERIGPGSVSAHPSPEQPVEGEPAAEEPQSSERPTGTDRPALGAIRRRNAADRAAATSADASGPEPSAGSSPPAVAAPEAVVAPEGQTPPAGLDAVDDTPAPAATPPNTDLSTAGGLPSRDQLVQAWGDQVISTLRPKAKALFQAGRFVGVDGDHAVYGLPNETHRTRCEDMRGEVEGALADHFGRPIPLRLVTDPGADPALDRPVPRAGSAAPTSSSQGAAGRSPGAGNAGPTTADADEEEDETVYFDESQLGEVADVGNLAEERLLQAFPGAEEVR